MTSVLIIDDHPIVLQGCRRMLEDAGIKTVLEARDATSGYRLYRRHHPDVVIVDLALQGGRLRGLDVMRRMRARGRGNRLRTQGHILGRTDEGVRPGAHRRSLPQQ